MPETTNIIEFPAKTRQLDNHLLHTINRGDEKMVKKDTRINDTSPTIKISLINYDPAKQDDYSKKFMLPLVEGLLKRSYLAQAE